MTIHHSRQQEIVETARKIISTSGMQGLTINAIAKELKLTDGALYRHFKSKREILEFLIHEIDETLTDLFESTVASIEDPLKALEIVFASHLSYAEQRKGVSFIIITETLNLNDKKLQKKMKEVLDRYIGRIENLLSEGIRKGMVREDIDPSSASIVYFGIIQSTVTLWALSGYRHSLKRGYLKLFRIFKSGIAQSPLH
ncbi:MAG: TetR/AcrR family transcriptional regulator [Candidatus Eremiobacteraeota bacterium]|nr:TetR/AcrR family transcriptional regulator [Candidatus Eremiobacteraeota bacterium]